MSCGLLEIVPEVNMGVDDIRNFGINLSIFIPNLFFTICFTNFSLATAMGFTRR